MVDEPRLIEDGSHRLLEDGTDFLLEIITAGSGPPDVSPPTIFVTAPGTDDILNLQNIGQRADTFAFELLDASRNTLGRLAVHQDAAPRITLDTSRSIARTCTGLALSWSNVYNDPAFIPLTQIDVRKHRIRPSLVLENGQAFPLGVFKIGDDNRTEHSWGETWTPDLFDETFLIDQPLDVSLGIGPGESVLGLYQAILSTYNLPAVDLSGIADVASSTALAYFAGKDTGNQSLRALAGILGCYPPYFDNAGVHRLKPAPATGATAEHVYMPGGRIIADSVKVTNSSYRAPNRYMVVSSDTTGGLVGIYDLPPTSPNSFAVTGERVRVSRNQPGIPTVALANLAAYIDALTDKNSAIKVTWDSTADPRHDAFDISNVHSSLVIESQWDIECRSGGVMSHQGLMFYG